jgi:hypothetical protein
MSWEYMGQTKNGILPNITGNIRPTVENTNNAYSDGAFYHGNQSVSSVTATWQARNTALFTFNASRCSSLYNNGDWYGGGKVIPSCIAMYYIIKY